MDQHPLNIFRENQMRELCAELTALGTEKATRQAAKLGLDANVRATLLTQVELRYAARHKLGEAALQMFFTRDGLEQATRAEVATLHAQRFLSAGATHVADLGCGNGADAVAFARAGLSVSAWDLDDSAHACATLNLAEFANCEAHLGDVTQLSVVDLTARGVDAIFADPARRTGAGRGNQRVAAPEDWSPSLPHVLSWRTSLLDYCGTERLGVKLAPGIDHLYLPEDMQAQWVSVDGALLEASLWSLACSPYGAAGRQATIFRAGQLYEFFAAGSPSQAAPLIPQGAWLNDFLWEADPAIIRAGLLHELAAAGSASVVSEGIAYLLAGTEVPQPWAPVVACFAVEEVVKLKAKPLVAALRALGATAVEVKKRGADVDPAALQRELVRGLKLKKTSTEKPFTVIATRFKGDHCAFITRRV